MASICRVVGGLSSEHELEATTEFDLNICSREERLPGVTPTAGLLDWELLNCQEFLSCHEMSVCDPSFGCCSYLVFPVHAPLKFKN